MTQNHQTSAFSRRSFLSLGGAAVLASGCDATAPSSTIRYRLTVEVATSSGIRSGSSVIEKTFVKGRSMGDYGGLKTKVRGEAVAIDVAPGRTLFALLRNDRFGPDFPLYVLHAALSEGNPNPPLSRIFGPDEWLAEEFEARSIKPTATLPSFYYPLLVQFRNIGDPKSIERVDPDDLGNSFVAGASMRRITIAISDEAVTTKIRDRLPEYGPASGFDEWYRSLQFDDPRRVTLDDFIRGI